MRSVLLLALAGTVCACGTASRAGSSTSAHTASETSPRAPSTLLVIGDRENHQTLRLVRGQVVEVRLHSTYWRFERPTPSVLSIVSGPTYSSLLGHGCVPGQGCGTARMSFRAIATGSADIVATRRVCGEAMSCTPSASRFAVAITVAQ